MEADFDAQVARIEQLVGEIERHSDPAVRRAARELVTAVLRLHKGALERILPHLDGESIAEDPLVTSLLALHDLHPLSLEERVRRAVAGLGSGVELLSCHDGRVRVGLLGTSEGWPPEREREVLDAIYRWAPDAADVSIVARQGAIVLLPVRHP